MKIRRIFCWGSAFIVAGALLMLDVGCGQETPKWSTSSGVVIQPPGKSSIGDEIRAATFARAKAMKGTGLAGAMGEIHVKAFKAGTYNVLLPMPQLNDAQVPVCYSISAAPEGALVECRLQDRNDGNVFLCVKLKGAQDQEIRIGWSSVILIANKAVMPNQAKPEEYLPATSCVQSGDKQVTELADKLWPGAGKTDDFARKIQGFIREMKQKEQPRSLDAVGILKSGASTICTANANLACSLMRSKKVPCRSIAVIPPMSSRLEMHRVVEYFDDGKWISFDPSMVQADIPLKPWHSVIMAKTTMADEETAMKPRMGAMFGCPFGQEVEFSSFGLNLNGNDFYWTIAGPLAEFEVSDEAVGLAAEAWKKYLQSGVTSAAQIKAASARDAGAFVAALR
jgi:hypothetical protein